MSWVPSTGLGNCWIWMRPNSFRLSGVNDADGLSVYRQTNPARSGQPIPADSCQCCSCSLSSQQCPHVLACLCTGPVSLWGWSHRQQAIRLHLALPSCPICDVRHLRDLHGCAPPGQTLTLLMLLFQWACAQANALRHVQGSTCHGKGAMVVASLARAMCGLLWWNCWHEAREHAERENVFTSFCPFIFNTKFSRYFTKNVLIFFRKTLPKYPAKILRSYFIKVCPKALFEQFSL